MQRRTFLKSAGLAGAAGEKIGTHGEHRQRDQNREREGENGKRQG